MEKQVRAAEMLYHLTKPNQFVQIALSRVNELEYEIRVEYSNSSDFSSVETGDVYTLSDLHEAMNVYRDCYVALLRKGYCYWGLIPQDRSEWERTAEKNRLLYFIEEYCHLKALKELREWRDEQADKEGVRRSAVFSDRNLRTLATFLPQNREELMNCPGIGEAKQTLYGSELLNICRRYKRKFSTPLPSILPKYKYKDGEEERFRPFRVKRIPAKDSSALREKVLRIGETGNDVQELSILSKIDDRETRRRVASAANKLRNPEVTRSIRHLLFDEGPQVRQFMLRAIISSDLREEMADDVRLLLEIEPKSYNRALCKRILAQ